MPLRPFVLPWVLLTAGVAGCSDRAELAKLVAAERAAVEPRLTAAAAIPGALRSTPPFASLTKIQDPPSSLDFAIETRNADVYHLEDLADLTKPGAVPFRLEGTTLSNGWKPLSYVRHLVDTGEWKGIGGANVAQGFVDGVKRLRYVLVVRTQSFRQVDAHEDETFEPANLDADAVLVELPTAAVLGGFPLHVSGRKSLYVTERNGPIRGMKFREKLSDVSDIQLRGDAMEAVGRSLKALVPGVRLRSDMLPIPTPKK